LRITQPGLDDPGELNQTFCWAGIFGLQRLVLLVCFPAILLLGIIPVKHVSAQEFTGFIDRYPQ
jgi:hypothetical protein